METTNGMPPRHDPRQEPVTKSSKLLQMPDLIDMVSRNKEQNEEKDINQKALEIYLARQQEEQEQVSPLFHVHTASEWLRIADARPVPRRLFDEFWYEGDLCILFADTNLGKSILAVQIADSISRGAPIELFAIECGPQRVIYFDFELHAKQFQARYSKDYKENYAFSPNLCRAEINPDVDYEEWGFSDFESYLHDQIEQYVVATGTHILIIDNLSALCTEAEQSKDAMPLMKMLNAIKKKHDLSILLVAHTPKRDYTRALTENDLQGSKAISNLCDSIMAIGRNNSDHLLRYIKQIKHRYGAKIYEEDNVAVCQIVKPDNFVRFDVIKFGRECDQIRVPEDKERGNMVAAAKDMHTQGKSQREIAHDLGISVGAVNKYINK